MAAESGCWEWRQQLRVNRSSRPNQRFFPPLAILEENHNRERLSCIIARWKHLKRLVDIRKRLKAKKKRNEVGQLVMLEIERFFFSCHFVVNSREGRSSASRVAERLLEKIIEDNSWKVRKKVKLKFLRMWKEISEKYICGRFLESKFV